MLQRSIFWKKIEKIRSFNIDEKKDDVLLQNFFANSMIQLVKEPTHTEGRTIVMSTIVFQKFLKNLVSH